MPAPVIESVQLETSMSADVETFRNIIREDLCLIFQEGDWSNRSSLTTDCNHCYHKPCLVEMKRMAFNPPPGVVVDEQGIAVPRVGSVNRERDVQIVGEADSQRSGPIVDPVKGRYHKPNSRGKISFTPNNRYGDGNDQNDQQNRSINDSPYHEERKVISQILEK